MSPIAFMVMPFNTKKPAATGPDVPTEVDFDALWHEVHRPVLESLGYVAVRADEDVGAVVVMEMVRRLALADLVVADVSLANSNVYYEVGVRHAAKRTHCVLVAASWADPVFDLGQIRQARYPLTDGTLADADAVAAARTALIRQLPPLIDGSSPFYQAMPTFPNLGAAESEAFADFVAQLNDFGTAVRTIRLTDAPALRTQLTRELVAAQGARHAVREAVVLELIALVRDNVGWTEVLSYIDDLRPALQQHPAVVEQRQLALAKTGRVTESAAALEQLIERCGKTSERLGLLGGRYKQLLRAATTEAARQRYLDQAIDAYEQGMRADLNDYYPASNLPRLYGRRGADGDQQRARDTLAVIVSACRASLDRRPDDPWARPTLLGAAFDRGDPDAARALVHRMRRDDMPQWILRTTLDDLGDSLDLLAPSEVRDELSDVLTEVREMAGR